MNPHNHNINNSYNTCLNSVVHKINSFRSTSVRLFSSLKSRGQIRCGRVLVLVHNTTTPTARLQVMCHPPEDPWGWFTRVAVFGALGSNGIPPRPLTLIRLALLSTTQTKHVVLCQESPSSASSSPSSSDNAMPNCCLSAPDLMPPLPSPGGNVSSFF